MKKLLKAITSTLLLGLICLCFSMTVFAETESGDLGNGFSYTINDDTKIIFIKGTGKFPDNCDEFLHNQDYEGYTLNIGNGITDCSNLCAYYCEKVILGKDVQTQVNTLSYPRPHYEVDSDNPYLSSYHGSLYTKGFQKLLWYSPEGEVLNDFHPNVSIIGKGAFARYWPSGKNNVHPNPKHIHSPYFWGLDNNRSGHPIIVIPWGVTTIEEAVFTSTPTFYLYVIPDTAVHLGKPDNTNFSHSSIPSWIPSRNNPSAWKAWQNNGAVDMGNSHLYANVISDIIAENITDIPSDYIASYYDLKPNSLKTFQNGKTYYFDSNYKTLKGWNYADGNWYYFNDYGAAVVKIWLKSGNKWYFMQADGTMATDKWVQWYNKWYYVGSDGAMYSNRYTPDGYWVNANGVWVQ